MTWSMYSVYESHSGYKSNDIVLEHDICVGLYFFILDHCLISGCKAKKAWLLFQLENNL